MGHELYSGADCTIETSDSPLGVTAILLESAPVGIAAFIVAKMNIIDVIMVIYCDLVWNRIKFPHDIVPQSRIDRVMEAIISASVAYFQKRSPDKVNATVGRLNAM